MNDDLENLRLPSTSRSMHIIGSEMEAPGRLGNRIFQAALARRIAEESGYHTVFSGFDPSPFFPNMDISDRPSLSSIRELDKFECNSQDFSSLRSDFEDSKFDALLLKGWGTRLENVVGLKDELVKNVESLKLNHRRIGADEVLVVVRCGETAGERPIHPDYFPLPVSFYEKVFRRVKRKPVFFGQLDCHSYVDTLKSAFPGESFIPGTNPLYDFETIRRARMKVLPISTFAWLAAWTGSADTQIIMPVAGAYNPVQRSDWNLLPLDDSRYFFYFFDQRRWERNVSLDNHLHALRTASLGFPRIPSGAEWQFLLSFRLLAVIASWLRSARAHLPKLKRPSRD